MIIYFSGTGNSSYLAGILAEKLGDAAVDGGELIKNGEYPKFFSEKPYVFVTPVYAWRIPRIFEELIKKCNFDGCKKVYFIINCGSEIAAAGKYARNFTKKVGLEFMGAAEVIMPENYLVMFDPTPVEKDEEIINRASEQVLKLAEKISHEETLTETKITIMDRLYSGIVNDCFYTFYIGAKRFYATDACIGCGKCAKSCVLNNITIKGGKPVWSKNCTHCMACICKCPAEAIEYGKKTRGRRRYTCPKKKGEL